MESIELKGYLRPLILKLLSHEGKKTGSELAEAIEERLGNRPSYGSIYPILQKLNKKGLLLVEKHGKEKRYSLSAKGKELVKEIKEKKQKQIRCMINLLNTFKTIFEDGEIEFLIGRLEEKNKKEGPYLPELLQIHRLLLRTNSVEEKKEKIRNELRKTVESLKEILEGQK